MKEIRKMRCQICGSIETEVIYDDCIRDGASGTLTKEKYQMYRCNECGTIWHKIDSKRNEKFYQSIEYREKLEDSACMESYHRLHDKEVLEKLQYTGTDIYRDARVADIGCGGGSFLDFLNGVADEIIAIEPSKLYREAMDKKGYHTYPYAQSAISQYKEKLDVVTSFDVIEHVDDPISFMEDVYNLLKTGGKAIIGTPSECLVMRTLMKKEYEQKLLYSFQHPWILSAESFEMCCKKAGFKNIKIAQKQRYGLSNMISWLVERVPCGHSHYEFVTSAMDDVYKRELEQIGVADYLIAYVEK